jgi:Protein of unknown function (DUF3489)
MKTFTIEYETNNIIVHPSVREAETVPNSDLFGDEAALVKLSADWPTVRLIEIWNSLPGATPVTKFRDRKTAVSRIWNALQSLGDAVPAEASQPEAAPMVDSPQEAEALPAVDETVPDSEISLSAAPVTFETPEGDVTSPLTPQTAHVATEAAIADNHANPAKDAPAAGTKKTREGSKTSQVIAMLKREGGTTLEEIMTAMGWQKHTTRAMLSAGGALTKNHGVVVTSEKIGDRRTYSIKA